MSVQTIKEISSYGSTSNLVVKPLDLTYFQLDENVCVSAKEIAILPDSYKNQIKDIFLRILKNKKVLDEIKKRDASSIAIKIQNKRLVYSLDGKNNTFLNDKKIQKAFEKVSRNIKRYLKNIKVIKDCKISNLSIKEQNLIKNRAFDIEKIKRQEKALKKRYPNYIHFPLKYIEKFAKADAEWSIWAVFLSDIQGTIVKAFRVLSKEVEFLNNIKGWDDWLGYIVGSFGVINGFADVIDAKKINDKEGKYDGIHKIIRNSFAIGAGTIDWIGKTIKATSHFVLKLALSISALFVFLFVTLYAMARFIYFDIKAIHFKKKLNEYLKNEKLSEEEKKIGALKFLKDKLMVSKRRSQKILKKIKQENSNLSDEKIQKIFNEKIINLIKTKVKRFERRVGSDLASVIQRNIKDILKNPENEMNIEKTNKIFERIQYKNQVTINENTLYSLAIAFQGIELALFIIIGATVPSFAIGAISTFLFIVLTIYSKYRQYVLKDEKKDKIFAEEIDKKMSLISQRAI